MISLMHAQSLSCVQLFATLCSPPGFSVHGILQARILEWVAILFSRGSSPARDQTQVSCIAGRFLMSEPPGKPNPLSQSVFLHIPFPFLPPHLSHSLLPSFLPASVPHPSYPFRSSQTAGPFPCHMLSPLSQSHTDKITHCLPDSM